MPKMPRDLSGHKVRRILEYNGFRFIKEKGDHMAMKKEVDGRTIKRLTVPNHDTVKIGTLGQIVRDSEKDRNEFIRVSQQI